ncbi:MAG: preprotein translocase subunit SecA, partial [Candidatus Riflebacteria bacterium]|nr:preprotein translocase subunit SecA [Candidatus Riflebacteria bacterium]
MFGWLYKLIRFFIPDFNSRELSRLEITLNEVNDIEDRFVKMSDTELSGMTEKFRRRLFEGEPLDNIKAEAFATVREAAKRVLNMRHYDVQILGGLALHEGRIVEMKTGEGKTLVATLPLYLNALELNPKWVDLAKKKGKNAFEPIFDDVTGLMVPVGRGALLVTVNDYLASRDSAWMGKIFEFLGMSVGLNIHGLDAEEKRDAYASDITYGTNNEFGFDYLRDNMALSLADCVQRSEYNYAIVDEVDSILIDEARTPLIISGPAEKATSLYFKFAQIAREMKPEEDYTIDEKNNGVSVAESGIAKVERLLGIENLYDDKNMDSVHHMQNALKAKHFFHKDKEYIVRPREDGRGQEVVIVDEFTGRLMFGRRYSDGLHQAIEAKEGVPIQQENQTLASITFQNYFRLYRKLAGMTGTAETEAKEFNEIYKCEVVVIPPNKPCVRKDMADVIYKTVKEKFEA